MNTICRWLFLGALVATAPPALAQGADPIREIQEIARRVDEQLQEIDRLLLESSKKDQARSQPRELLKQAREHSEAVEGGLDRLIEKLNEMKNRSSSSSSDSQQQNPEQDQQQSGESQQQRQQGNRNRRENQTEEFAPRPRPGQQQGNEPQPGQAQPEPPRSGTPQGGQEAQDAGQNTRGNKQPEPELGPGQPGEGDQTWGELQGYTNHLKNRGSAPRVPEKYRKYWEAYLRQKQATDGSGSGGSSRGAGGGTERTGNGGR